MAEGCYPTFLTVLCLIPSPTPFPSPFQPWGHMSLIAVLHNEGKDRPPLLAAGLFFLGIRDHKGAWMPPACVRVCRGVCVRMRVPVRVFSTKAASYQSGSVSDVPLAQAPPGLSAGASPSPTEAQCDFRG